MHLLSGTLQVGIGGRRYELTEGDSITYVSSVPHYWVNAADTVAVIIGAVTPPSF